MLIKQELYFILNFKLRTTVQRRAYVSNRPYIPSSCPMTLDLQTMQTRATAYLTSLGLKDWSISEPFKSTASTVQSVMESRITFDEKKSDQKIKVIVMRESWTMHGGMEWGSTDIQALMRVCDSSGKEINTIKIPDEDAIEAFLEKHLLSGEKLTAYKQGLILEQQRESRLAMAVQECVREQDITEMVRTVMRAGIDRLGKQDAQALRARFSDRIEKLT